MIKVDMHTHSKYSIDSKETIENMCLTAIQQGIHGLCITDHIDYNPNDYGFDFYKRDEYLKAVDQAKSRFKDDLLVLSGIEFSEPHLYTDQLTELKQFGYDVILGSIHWIDDKFLGQKELLEIYSQKEIEEIYYDMVLKTVDYGQFDVLAHLDIPKRYFGCSSIEETIIKDILELMIHKNIALEINTSSYRKNLDESLPSISIVESYIELGGDRLTLGSDAHIAGDIGDHFDKVLDGLSNTAKSRVGTFINRQFHYLEDIYDK